MTTAQDTGLAVTGPRAVFSRVPVGVDGSHGEELSREIEREQGTLVVGGSHGNGRAAWRRIGKRPRPVTASGRADSR